MPLDTQMPPLDTRTFEQLKREALLRIPRYTPDWTDFNESDPGVTLVELFAWLTEMMLYQMNQVPKRNYIKFLEVLGLELEPAQAARAYLTFTATAGAAEVASVLPGSQVGAQPSSGGDQLIFETTEGLDLVRLGLTNVQVFDGSGFTDVTTANATPATTIRPFGWLPQPGSALYLGFAPTSPPAQPPIFPQEIRFGVFLPLAATAGQPVHCPDMAQPPAPSVTLVWEYRPKGSTGRWRRLNTFRDDSVAFTREGCIEIEGPRDDDIAPTVEGNVASACYWLRARLSSGSYPTGQAPLVDFLRANVAHAENLTTIRGETLGNSDGSAGQVFTLLHRPIYHDSLRVTVQEGDQPPPQWAQKPDFLASGPDDQDYTLNEATGEIKFGDGKAGRIPVAGARITAQEYRYGGGVVGNVKAGQINAPLTYLAGVETVINERPAAGGGDEQDIAEFLQRAPAQLRHADRAVSRDDFAALAEQTGGVARAVALPLFHPDHPGVEVPGAITVVIVPDTPDVHPPRPSPAQLEAVCDYLNQRRLLTTELFVKGPEFHEIRVQARVAVQPSAAFGAVERQVIDAINGFLDPLGNASRSRAPASLPSTTSPNGYSAASAGAPASGLAPTQSVLDFGADLYPTVLYSVIQGVPQVVAVLDLTLLVDGVPHDDYRVPVSVPPDGLVYGASSHDITIEPYRP